VPLSNASSAGLPTALTWLGVRMVRYSFSCMTLSFTTSRRFIPTLSRRKRLPHQNASACAPTWDRRFRLSTRRSRRIFLSFSPSRLGSAPTQFQAEPRPRGSGRRRASIFEQGGAVLHYSTIVKWRARYESHAIVAAAGMVSTQAHTMLVAMPQRTAFMRWMLPTPAMAPAMACVVDTGVPI
jgi:hypothetical protein